MENWLGIGKLERGRRDSFLINKKATEIEIYRAKGLFKQIESAATTIETLVGELRFSGSKSNIKGRIGEHTIHLIITYSSLKELLGDNKNLKEQLNFDLVKGKSSIAKVLERIANLSCTGTIVPQKMGSHGKE